MKSSGKRLICLLSLLVLGRLAWAVTTDSAGSAAPAAETSTGDAKSSEDTDKPYSAIWLRNVFDLKPVPEVKAPVETNKEAPPTARLIGLFDMAKIRHAIFVETKPPEAGKPSATSEVTLMMAEGDRKDGIEVLEIDIPGKKAKVKIDEQVYTYNLETNKAAAGGPPAGGGRPGGVPGGRPGGVIGGGPGAPPVNQGNYDRMIRGQGGATPQAYPQAQNNYIQPGGYAGGNYGSATPGLSLPGSTLNQVPTGNQAAPEQSVPAEVTAAILAAQKAAANQLGRPFPPIPGGLDVGGQEAPGGGPPTTTPPPPPIGQKITGNFPGVPK